MVSFRPDRRMRSIDRPYSRDCLATAAVAFILMAGHYALLVPCMAWPAAVVPAIVHVFGLSVYASLLRCDPGSPPSEQPAEGLRKCTLCNYYVPDHKRTIHCRVCHKCVDGYDHHCTFLNSCVGATSYRRFLTLISMLLIGTAIHVALDMLLLVGPQWLEDRCSRPGSPFYAYERHSALRSTLLSVHALLSLICCLGVAVLLGLHGYLHHARKTTREFTLWLRAPGEESKKRLLSRVFCMPPPPKRRSGPASSCTPAGGRWALARRLAQSARHFPSLIAALPGASRDRRATPAATSTDKHLDLHCVTTACDGP